MTLARRRFTEHKPAGSPKVIAPDHPAAKQGRTVYPATVVYSGAVLRIFKSGQNSRKIGSHVTKGRWSGFPIYTLTLEERATCPRTCREWLSCYGSKMPFVERLVAGPQLEGHAFDELAELSDRHPDGFVVRLHVLGDFYSPAYIWRWLEWLYRFPALNCFGYTAYPPDSECGRIIARGRQMFPDRFEIRFSHGPEGTFRSFVVDHEEEADGAIVCPAQTGRTECCGTCALCWSTDRPIAFLRH